MPTKRGKRSTKKVKSLSRKTLTGEKAKRVRGGSFSFGVKTQGLQQKVLETNLDRLRFK